jgi:hypothetical protein
MKQFHQRRGLRGLASANRVSGFAAVTCDLSFAFDQFADRRIDTKVQLSVPPITRASAPNTCGVLEHRQGPRARFDSDWSAHVQRHWPVSSTRATSRGRTTRRTLRGSDVNIVARVRLQGVEEPMMPLLPAASDQAATGRESTRKWNNSRE